jgi:6-pyruvoyl-tetrahydropterin synthase
VIPTIDLLTQEIEEVKFEGRTYKVEILTDSEEDRINGFVDELESIKQAIYLILSTERYKYIIYSWDYGVELVDLIGKPIPYCMAEIPRRVKEALLVDNRIENVTDFQFEHIGKTLHTTFTVVTNVGNVETRLEVDI